VTLPPGQEGIDNVGRNSVSAGYFEVMRIPLVAGRPIMEGDHASAPPVIVVNETFARTVFPAGDALGRTVPLNDGPPFTIVGIARDATYYELGETPRMQVYSPTLQFFQPSVAFVVRTAGPPLESAKLVQDALHALDPDLAFSGIASLQQIEADQVASFRASAHVVGLSGFIALLLASAGLYGVMACRVSERTREIGVRLALGQTSAGVARTVLAGGLRLTLAGLALGTIGVLALGRLITSLLFATQPRDPLSLLIAPLVLLTVAGLALLIPAVRAMRIDPMRAIRAD
jgi:ABC-type antimicrobial peptide transport system permease subunit